jgi:hypothetical protein
MEKITKLEWQILDSLSEDKECIAAVNISKNSKADIKKTTYELYQKGLLYEVTNQSLDYNILMSETENAAEAHYWFGLTQLGAEYWEKHSRKYSGNYIDWSQACIGYLDFQKNEGYLDGTSKRVCLNSLQDLVHAKDRQIDVDTIQYSKTEGFYAKYFKYITGGHRITFKLSRKTSG